MKSETDQCNLQENTKISQDSNRLRQEQRLPGSQKNMKASMYAAQDMLVLRNSNDSAAQNKALLLDINAVLSTAQQFVAAEKKSNNRYLTCIPILSCEVN